MALYNVFLLIGMAILLAGTTLPIFKKRFLIRNITIIVGFTIFYIGTLILIRELHANPVKTIIATVLMLLGWAIVVIFLSLKTIPSLRSQSKAL
jgi:uncharacterized membrane protein YjjP (DUF1212 family)